MSKKKAGKSTGLPNFINGLDAHHKLYASLVFAAVVSGFCYGHFATPMLLMLTWLAYAVMSILLSWITILSSHPADMKLEATTQDSSRIAVFVFVVIAAFASLLAILLLLEDLRNNTSERLALPILIPLACVCGAWWMVHTVFTFRYAHLFYCDNEDAPGKDVQPGGLLFPGEEEPDYLDFTYFSFVMGMTFQVSDVQITSRKIRRLAWMHGILSFAFNTVIVAFTINIIAGLIQK